MRLLFVVTNPHTLTECPLCASSVLGLPEGSSWAWNQPAGSREADWAPLASRKVGSSEPRRTWAVPGTPTLNVPGSPAVGQRKNQAPRVSLGGLVQAEAQTTGQTSLGLGVGGAGYSAPRGNPAQPPGKPTDTYSLWPAALLRDGDRPVVPDGSVESNPVHRYVPTDRPAPLVHKRVLMPPIPQVCTGACLRSSRTRTYGWACPKPRDTPGPSIVPLPRGRPE